MRPSIFIGSSSEHLQLARAVQQNLDRDFETRVWDQGTFQPSTYPLEALAAELERADFGAFILAPSDIAVIRAKRVAVARDNVIFELGLFIGRIGRTRSFVIVPRNERMHLPSDLLAFTVLDYDAARRDRNVVAAVAPACDKIRTATTTLSVAPQKSHAVLQRCDLFEAFKEEFHELLRTSKKLTVMFIHSRRWRENHNDDLRRFLKKRGATLSVFLPNLDNDKLMMSLVEHFDDGPNIPGFVADAYRYFSGLSQVFPGKVTVRLFDLYPAYSFYKFDNVNIVAMYCNSPIRKGVPTFAVPRWGCFHEFLEADLKELHRQCRSVPVRRLLRLVGRFVPRSGRSKRNAARPS